MTRLRSSTLPGFPCDPATTDPSSSRSCRFHAWICGVLFASAAALHAVTPVPAGILAEQIPGAKPRNVVFILSDDHRHDAMSFLGHQFAQIPVMDSLAANGAPFKNALVTTAYCETLRSVDDSIGRMLQQLKDMGIYEETLVIYMGDNGFMFGEHGLIDKRVAYETSMRVPMLVQCPALIKGGTVVNEIVANIDVAPTIMEAMGLKKPAHMDGESFLPLAEGKRIPWREQFLYVYYWEKDFPQTPTAFALRSDRYKYITYYGLWDNDEYYDIQSDPNESRNLIRDPAHKKHAKEMENKLYQMMGNFGGMEIPLNQPSGASNNIRLRSRGGEHASDFPPLMVVDEPVNTNAN